MHWYEFNHYQLASHAVQLRIDNSITLESPFQIATELPFESTPHTIHIKDTLHFLSGLLRGIQVSFILISRSKLKAEKILLYLLIHSIHTDNDIPTDTLYTYQYMQYLHIPWYLSIQIIPIHIGNIFTYICVLIIPT